MKKFLKLFFASLLTIAIIGVFSCQKPKACETNHTGGLVLWNYGPSYAWPTMGVEVDWADGTFSTVTFNLSYTWYDIPAGNADVYCTWEDANYYYYSSGYINVIQCQMNEGNCTYSAAKGSASTYNVTNVGQSKKTDFGSMNEFIQSLKTK